ncbi:MAG: hypothetical protein ACF8MF_06800 [Phycisphaerales bacterium JB052]
MSRSPFDVHGRSLAQEPRRKRLPLYGGRYETPFLLAHRAAGEWRLWRSVVESSGATDPFDLRRFEHGEVGYTELLADFGLDPLTVHSASSDLAGLAYIHIEDVSEDSWHISFAPEGEDPGEAVLITEDDLRSPATGPLKMFLHNANKTSWIELGLERDLDQWLALWLQHDVPIVITGQHANTEVTVPLIELGTAQ